MNSNAGASGALGVAPDVARDVNDADPPNFAGSLGFDNSGLLEIALDIDDLDWSNFAVSLSFDASAVPEIAREINGFDGATCAPSADAENNAAFPAFAAEFGCPNENGSCWILSGSDGNHQE